MKKIFTIFILLALMGMNEIHAQKHGHNWCGTTYEDETKILERLVRNRAKYANQTLTRMPTMWTPIKFHIINKNDGTGGVSPIKIYEMMCTVNEEYADQDIQFFIKGDFNYINSTSSYNNPGNGHFSLSLQMDDNAINIFLSKGIEGVSSGAGTLGYYLPFYDFLVVREDQISGALSDASTMVHELGHYFTLAHPFRGWPGDGYDEVMYGNPAPNEDSQGGPTELMDGSNCMQAADMICDTPPNYNFGFGWNGCEYDGSVMDPNGTPVDPDEANHMDYFIGCSTDFTDDQKVAIAQDLASRPNIHTSEDFDVTPLADVEMIAPIDEVVLPVYNSVNFEWTEVPGATSYVLEIDEFASFVLNPKVYFSTTNSLVLENLEANEKYYWRVKAIKDGYFCSATADDSSTGQFRTGSEVGGTAVNEISEVVGYSIAPNPLSSNQSLNISLETTKSFDAKINLYNLSGQKMMEVDYTFNLGNTNYELPVTGLAEGLYILSIESESGVLNEKIVVTK